MSARATQRRTASFCGAVLALMLSGCEYAKLARPSVLSQMNPPVVRLVNVLPELDEPNEAILAELYATGGLAHAVSGPDNVMRAHITVPKHHMLWTPAVIMMPHGGPLELRFSNYDQSLHMAYVPSNGGRKLLHLPPGAGGVARIDLDQPGLYWFGCPVADHIGRGMLGLIIVRGEAPVTARLDRPPQKRPGDG